MCGIAGIFDADKRPTAAELAPMVQIQSHRGPDAEGSLVDGPVAIGMRRLSIIDLSGGDQPIFNEDGCVAVVFNGEIYNYRELCQELISKGHRFKTRSDTEVLVHLYEEYGMDMLPRLNGMFGFALWDRKAQTLLVARDRMGVKPLYYARIGSRWVFSSEMKALHTQPSLDTTLDEDALADFLRLSYIPLDGTPYKSVRRLLPGHVLRIRPDGGEVFRWWDLAEWEGDLPENPSSLEESVRELFDDAVTLRMRSDVPVASFLSGGLDSSLVTVTAQQQSPLPIQTFTLGFEHTDFDETPYASAVARQAGTLHRELTAGTRDAIDYLPRLVWHMDEPMGDSSIIPNFLISRFSASHVKVCLSGLGGDELFGGYARYSDPALGRIRSIFRYAPLAARWMAPRVTAWHYSWGEELRLAGDASQAWRAYLHRIQIFNPSALRKLGMTATGRAEQIFETLWNRFPGTDAVSRRQFIDQHTYLPDTILALTDRMSMANSLEVRVPFMDYRLVRFSQRFGSRWKQHGGDFKILLKRALGSRCPAELLNRPKWGFDTPLSRWVSQPEMVQILQTLPEGLAARENVISSAAVRALVESPATIFANARRLWNLLILEVWLSVRGHLSAPAASLRDLLLVYA